MYKTGYWKQKQIQIFLPWLCLVASYDLFRGLENLNISITTENSGRPQRAVGIQYLFLKPLGVFADKRVHGSTANFHYK